MEGGSGAPSATAQLYSKPIAVRTRLVPRPADHREELGEQEQVAVEREAGPLHLAMYSERASRLSLLKRHGNGSHSKTRRAMRTTCTVRAGRRERKRASGLGDRDLSLGRRQPVLTRGECLRDRSQSSELGGPQPRRAPSGGAAGEPTRPASDQSSSDAKTRDPSTIPLSR